MFPKSDKSYSSAIELHCCPKTIKNAKLVSRINSVLVLVFSRDLLIVAKEHLLSTVCAHSRRAAF